MKHIKSKIARVVSSIFIMFIFVLSLYKIGNCGETTNKIYFNPPGQNSNTVTLVYNGTVYPEGWLFNEVQAGAYNASADENFIVNAVNTFINGTSSDVVNLYAPDEQAGIANSNIYAQSRGFYNGVTASAFIAKILYGSYEIFIIQHSGNFGNTMFPYTITNVDGKFYLTQKLQSDTLYLYFTDKYMYTLPFKQIVQ